MASKQELFTKVTGLTFDVEEIKDNNELAWLIPDGAMLDGDGEKAAITKEFMSVIGLDADLKFSTAEVEYDDEEENTDNSSNNE